MDIEFCKTITGLNDPTADVRLASSHDLGERIKRGEFVFGRSGETNNHIHTRFSFSPYFPAYAVWLSRLARLQTCGSIDHDSFVAAPEMKRVGDDLGIGTTVGVELRTDLSELGFGDRRINCPDKDGIAYVVAHGIPIIHYGEVCDFLAPINHARNLRNQNMVRDMNSLINNLGIRPINYNTDVFGQSEARNGGSITERHLLYALSQSILDATRPDSLLGFLGQDLDISDISDKQKAYLEEPNNSDKVYDLLGVLKSNLLPKFYISPDAKECIPVSEFLSFFRSVGAISTYAYLGDVADSPTGDKKAAEFEDSYLDDLMSSLKGAGFDAIAYMLPRNTDEQRARIMNLCDQYLMMQINGVDINSSRQSFNCPILDLDGFGVLRTSAWALVGHEYALNNGTTSGLELCNCSTLSQLNAQLREYEVIGRELIRRVA